jgi:hypothetical protein
MKLSFDVLLRLPHANRRQNSLDGVSDHRKTQNNPDACKLLEGPTTEGGAGWFRDDKNTEQNPP